MKRKLQYLYAQVYIGPPSASRSAILLGFGLGLGLASGRLAKGGWAGRREVGEFPPPCSGSLCDIAYAYSLLLQATKAPGIYFPCFPLLPSQAQRGEVCLQSQIPVSLDIAGVLDPVPLKVS